MSMIISVGVHRGIRESTVIIMLMTVVVITLAGMEEPVLTSSKGTSVNAGKNSDYIFSL